MSARQARLRAEAAVLVGARSAAPGEEGARDEGRRPDGQPAPLGRRLAPRRRVHPERRARRRPRGPRLDQSSVGLLAAGHPPPGGAEDRRGAAAAGTTAASCSGSARRWPARTAAYPAPDTLSWDLFLGVAPQVDYHPLYHPFNWRGWVDWGQGALGDMGAHLMDFPVWALKLGLPTVIETETTPFNGVCYPERDDDAISSSRRGRACRR